MRKHFYLVTEHEKEDRVGTAQIYESRRPQPLKNEERPITVIDEDKQGSKQVGKMVGLGYADFSSEDDFEQRVGDVLQKRVQEVDDKWQEKAGVDFGDDAE